jgi:tetratricopeptide (TPR) repeat protein
MRLLCLAPFLLLPFAEPDSPGGHARRTWREQLFHLLKAETAFADGRLADAEKEFAAGAADHPATALRLAEVRLAVGKYVRAEQLCQQTWPVLARRHGLESPEVARCLDIQARACAALGIDHEAARLAHLAWDIRTKKLPRDHFEIAESIHTRRALWRPYEALPLIATGSHSRDGRSDAAESLKIQEKALPPGDPRLARCLLAAAREVTWDDTDELPLAEKRLLAAIDLVKTHRGERNPALADYWTELARIYGAKQKLALAEETQQKAITLLRDLHGERHPRLARPLAIMSMIRASLGKLADAESLVEEASRSHFSALTDVELCASFDRLQIHDRKTEYLLEMARRKGPTITKYLARKHDELLEARREVDPGTAWRHHPNLELLTALRRAQNRPDPLPVILGGPEQEESIFPNLPVIEAALVNRDFQKKPVGYQDGGDYRSGRQERWRFDVRDARGNPVPVKPREDPEVGGLLQNLTLKHGASWDTVLDMRRFIDLTPGEYTVRVEYHDRKEISSHLHTAGLMLCRSEPFKLTVQPRVIDVTKPDREAVKAAVAAINEKDKVRILAGTYAKADHEFIAPASPAGKILTLGWKAVPALLDELENPKLTPHRRAWVLALLFSITSWNDPRDEAVSVGRYESRSRGWAVSGGRNGKTIVIGAGSGGGKLVFVSDTIDEKRQKVFAEKWKAFREYLVIRDRDR